MGLKLVVGSLSRLYRLSTVGLLCCFLVASCSGLGSCFKRVLLQNLRLWIWKVILEQNTQVRNIKDEAAAMAAATAVKAASSAASQVACLSQVMLTAKAEEMHQIKNFISTLQAVSLKLNKAELITRGLLDNMDRIKELSARNGMPLAWHLRDESYNLQWKVPSSEVNCVSSSRGNSVETPQPTKQVTTFQAPSFLEVMAMLERGETPPGIKKINDKPPIPNQLPSASCLKPKPKPWERKDTARARVITFTT